MYIKDLVWYIIRVQTRMFNKYYRHMIMEQKCITFLKNNIYLVNEIDWQTGNIPI